MSTPQEPWCTESESQSPTAPTGKPNLRPVTPSALCSRGYRRITITGLLKDTLSRHFYDPSNFDEDSIDSLVWRPDERTAILIESIYKRTELLEKRPAVIIKPNAMTNMRLGINDSLGPNEQGHEQYQTFWVGSHTLFCLWGAGASAEVLADEVRRELSQFHDLFTRYLLLHRWQVTEVGEVATLEEAKQTFVVPVTVGWVFEEKWRIEKESLKIRKISVHNLLDGAFVS